MIKKQQFISSIFLYSSHLYSGMLQGVEKHDEIKGRRVCVRARTEMCVHGNVRAQSSACTCTEKACVCTEEPCARAW